MAQTAITYPGTTLRHLTGAQIKDALEDIADNLFNSDPYYRQGGDMVRTRGLSYNCNPRASIGRRIGDLRLNGATLSPGQSYRVAGWASVKDVNAVGAPMWESLQIYLREKKSIRVDSVNTPKLL